jgi:hypothetical protein
LRKVALVAAALIAVLGLGRPAAADETWGRYAPPGFPPPPNISLFIGNTPPMFRPQQVYVRPQRRFCPPRPARYGHVVPGYGYGYSYRAHPRQVIIVGR